MVAGMSNFVSNPFKATTSSGNRVSKIPTQKASLSNNGRMLPNRLRRLIVEIRPRCIESDNGLDSMTSATEHG